MNEDRVDSSREFGKIFAKSKFNELIVLEITTNRFLWNNFPELYVFHLRVELLKFHNYNRLNFDYLEEVSIAAFIDEGYKLKESYLKDLQLNNS